MDSPNIPLCFLALLLARIAERHTSLTRNKIRSVMERMHIGEFQSKKWTNTLIFIIIIPYKLKGVFTSIFLLNYSDEIY